VSDQLANVRLPKPCAGCKKSDSAERPVLKMPVPLETANLNAACLPLHHRDSEKRATDTSSYRCYTCCEGRVWARCEKWWCEECLPGFRDVNLLRRTPGGGSILGQGNGNMQNVKGVWLGCTACQTLCAECLFETRERCRRCRAEFCGVQLVSPNPSL